MLKRFFIGLSLLCFASASFAAEAPDELVKRTAEDVLMIIKTDKDIQAGNQEKLFALTEEKILPNFNFDKVSRLVLGKQLFLIARLNIFIRFNNRQHILGGAFN